MAQIVTRGQGEAQYRIVLRETKTGRSKTISFSNGVTLDQLKEKIIKTLKS